MIAYLTQAVCTCRFVPKICDIREACGLLPKEQAQDAEAEAAWRTVVTFADRWHPDIGRMTGCPTLTDREATALRSIGGVLVVQEEFGGKSFQFLKKEFIASWKRLAHLEGLAALEAGPEAKRLSGGFQSVGEMLKTEVGA